MAGKMIQIKKEVSFGEALKVWWRIGFLSFGGPAGQIALMHRILIDEKHWIDEPRFLHALNYCMLLPGPEAQQLATYIGWLMHGVRGGLAAGLIFILPGAVIMLLLSTLYVVLGDLQTVDGFFFGMKAAVFAIVIQALLRISRRALRGRGDLLLAFCGWMALFVFNLPFPLIVFAAALYGYLAATGSSPAQDTDESPLNLPAGTRATAVVCLLLWIATVVGLLLIVGQSNVYTQIALFFSKLAIVTFGGAYAVLSYMAQHAVEQYHWLQPGEMLDGLALAETTPGPLILVTQFVGFLAALREAGPEAGLFEATLGAVLTTWITFLPCFFWIFAGAPYVEKLRQHRALGSALASVSAAIVGVIANLAFWFGLHALFSEHITVQGYGVDMELPVPASLDLAMLALICIACFLIFRLKMDMLKVLGLCAVSGIVWTTFL